MFSQKFLRSMLSSSWKYVLIIVVCIGVVYVQALHFEFVTYDDYELVYQNSEFLSQIKNALTSFTTHAFTTHRSESAYYRPILLISFIVDYKFWQLNPLGYHLTNLLLHCLTAIGVLILAEKIFRDKLLALLASLLFALHPIQTESVAWVSGRNDILLGLFVVAMVLSYIHYYEDAENRKRYLFLSWLSYLLAIFTKESGVFYILLLPLYDLCIRRISLRTLLSRNYVPNLVVPIIFFVFYLLIRWNAIGEIIGADKLYGQVLILERIVQIPGLFTKYLSLLLLPWRLSVVHPPDQLIWFDLPFNILAFVITLFIIGGIVISWRKNPLICFSLLWLVVGLLPALNIFPLAVQILEHRLYVPSIGFVLIITFGVHNLLTKIRWVNGYRYTLVAILLIYGYLSYIRLPIWQNSETLWTDAIEKAPNSSRAYFNLAGYYFEQQQYEKTIDMLKKYLPLKPNDFLGYSKLRQTYFIMGRYDQAADVCRQMIALNPRNENRYIEMGKFFEQLNMIDSAKAIYLEGLLVDSNFAELHYHLGRLYEYENNLVLAEHEYHRVIVLTPSHALAYFDLGRLLVRKNDYHLAISTIEKGMQFANPSKEVLQLLSTLYVSTGNEQKAQELIRRFSY